jgi:hypothetical protein
LGTLRSYPARRATVKRSARLYGAEDVRYACAMLRRPLSLAAAVATCVTLSLTLAACGESATKPANSPNAASARVEPAEMEMGDGKESIKIHADGTIEAPKGGRIGTLRASGDVVNAEGKSVATLGADGKVDFGADGEGVVATIADDGGMTLSSKGGETFTARIGDDGVVTGTNPSAGKLVIKGADTPAKKRGAMLVLLAVLIRKEAGPAPAPMSGGPEAAPPATIGKP